MQSATTHEKCHQVRKQIEDKMCSALLHTPIRFIWMDRQCCSNCLEEEEGFWMRQGYKISSSTRTQAGWDARLQFPFLITYRIWLIES